MDEPARVDCIDVVVATSSLDVLLVISLVDGLDSLVIEGFVVGKSAKVDSVDCIKGVVVILSLVVDGPKVGSLAVDKPVLNG